MKKRHLHPSLDLPASYQMACLCSTHDHAAQKIAAQDTFQVLQGAYKKCRGQVRFFFRLILNTSRENSNSMLR